ncbi:hypothetical protein ACFFRR_011448 [Megaselia abdita]
MVSNCPDGDIFVTSLETCRPASQYTCDGGNTGGNTGSNGQGELCGKGKAYGPYVEDCAAFVDCITNEVRRCLNGEVFDIVKSMCRPVTEATCYEGSGDDIPQYVKMECATLPQGSFVSHRNCEKYYICNGAAIVVANCPAGKHFSRAYNGCVPILQAGCRVLGTVCIGQSTGYTFPSLQCPQYYSCPPNGIPVLNSCPANNVYNPNSESCVPSSTYNCDENIEVPGASTNYPPTEQTIPVTTTTTAGPGFDPNAACSTVSSGTKIANPNDCTKYYMCNNGAAIPLVCYQGQYFSAKNQLCSTTNPSC